MSGTIPAVGPHAAAATAAQVLAIAPTEGDTLALVSGGHDSLTAMHVADAHPHIDLDGIVHINTGIGIGDTRRFIQQRAQSLNLTYHEVGAPSDDPGYTSEYRYETENTPISFKNTAFLVRQFIDICITT